MDLDGRKTSLAISAIADMARAIQFCEGHKIEMIEAIAEAAKLLGVSEIGLEAELGFALNGGERCLIGEGYVEVIEDTEEIRRVELTPNRSTTKRKSARIEPEAEQSNEAGIPEAGEERQAASETMGIDNERLPPVGTIASTGEVSVLYNAGTPVTDRCGSFLSLREISDVLTHEEGNFLETVMCLTAPERVARSIKNIKTENKGISTGDGGVLHTDKETGEMMGNTRGMDGALELDGTQRIPLPLTRSREDQETILIDKNSVANVCEAIRKEMKRISSLI